MKSTVETLEPTRVKVAVDVPWAELKPSLDAAYQRIAKQVNIPGFRKGKVPPPVIDRQVGRGAVLDEAINEALPKLYVDALQANDLTPLAQPDIEITNLDDGNSLAFTAEVVVRPQLTLPAYDDIAVTVDDATVTDSDLDEQLEGLRERFGTLADVERAAAEGDFVTIDLNASLDGEDIDGGQVAGHSYKVGSGEMLPGIDEVLVGMSAGDEKDFTSQLLGGDFAGQDVDVKVTVSAVKEQELPELDDDFAQTASEFDTLDELKADLRERLGNGKRLEQAAAARDAVLEKVLDQTEVPIPDSVVAEELEARKNEMNQQLAWAGMTLEQYLDNEKQTVDEFDADLEKRVRDSIAAQFVLDELAKQRELGVEQEELSEHLWRRAQQSGQDPNEFVKHMVEHNHLPEMVSEVLRGKALADLVENATVTDESGNVVDLANLRPDGTIGDPEAEQAEAVADAIEEAAADEA